ncbi:MAG: ribonuclease H-like domain-containing protein [Deltaproteobacteria bacterium]|nr:ribonuclease H-like domain-containing protein [Deltaproteobacteria bacterium]
MNVIDRLKRLSGETKQKPHQPSRQAEIGELRNKIETIMARRPDATIRTAPQNAFRGKGRLLTDLICGEEIANAFGRFYVVPGNVDGSSCHGNTCVRDCAAMDMQAAAFIANDPDIADCTAADGLFLDTETTGLMGGTGTLAFLIGLGWFEGDVFVTRQIFARDFAEEQAALVFLNEIVRDRKFLVTFNGKAFDIGLLTTRLILNRLPNPFSAMPHLDLLHPSRRLFGSRLINHRLATLEESIIGFYREDDLPGSEIPQRYFDWLKRHDARLMVDVFEHNRLDIISMAALARHLTELMNHPADSDRCHPSDLLCAAKLFHDRGQVPEAHRRLLSLMNSDNDEVKAGSLKLLSLIHKRAGRWAEAVAVWETMLEHDPGDVFALTELAKWCEHRLRDVHRAEHFVSTALACVETQKGRNSLVHRSNRLQKRLHDNS